MTMMVGIGLLFVLMDVFLAIALAYFLMLGKAPKTPFR